MEPIRWYLQRLLWRRRSVFSLLLVGIALALALALRVLPGARIPDAAERLELYRDAFGPFLMAAILPLLALLHATPAFAAEAEEQTLFLLLTRPVPRWKILLQKAAAAWLACALVGVPAVLLPALVLLELGDAGARHVLLGYALAAALATTAYSLLFLRVGLARKRPLIWAAAWAIGWEGLLGTMPGNLQMLTVQHQSARFLARHTGVQSWTLELPLEVPAGSVLEPAACLLVASAALLFLSWRRWRSFALDA